VDVLVGAPLLSTPLVGIVVVPLIVGLGVVGLGASVVEGDSLGEVLIATIGIPLILGLAPLLSTLVLRGVLVVGVLAVTVATLGTGSLSGGSGAVLVGGTALVLIAVLTPLVVLGTDGALVVLVVVRLGRDGVVRLAPPGVSVLTVVLLSPLVVVVSGLLGSVLPRGTLFFGLLLGLSTVGLGLVAGSVTVAVALGATVAVILLDSLVGLATVSELGLFVISGRSVALLGRVTVVIAVLAPLLGTVLIVVLVVPLIVGLSTVGFSSSVAVSLVVGEVLIPTIGIELVP